MTTDIIPDTQHRSLISALPAPLRNYALLARFDRPIGWWLLYWPCAWGLLLAGGLPTIWGGRWDLLGWLLLGAIAMRGAGCVYNDIVDADLDRQVARTAARPLASGAVSKLAAWLWLVLLSLIGLAVLLQLRWEAQIVALASLALVAAYPFMKRITWWPQAWLGLVFSWGALVGIRSSALRLGAQVQGGVAGFYGMALAFWGVAFWQLRPDWLALAALLPVALHLGWQVLTLDEGDPVNPLARFRANRFAGLLMAMACWVVGNA